MIDPGWYVPHLGNDRTIYVIGLFGTGRWYTNDLITQNIGERARYFRDYIRVHPGPTSMIYSNHATIKYVSRGQYSPAVMNNILKAMKSGFADLMFVYRHPLDSLLTNWIWWRTFIRDRILISGISQVYRNTDDLCTDLDQNFLEFKAFAEGDPKFFATAPSKQFAPYENFNYRPLFEGHRFLSFPEFVEETNLHLQFATLPLRLEDFTTDPVKEFLKIARIMSINIDLSCARVAPPETKPYRYLAVKEKVRRFKDFIVGLNAETKRGIEKVGYDMGI
jgi:hypothetical protein